MAPVFFAVKPPAAGHLSVTEKTVRLCRVSILRRLCGVALPCALLSTTFIGSGEACAMLGMPLAATDRSMPDMPMADMPMPDMPSRGSDRPSSDSHSDCPLPWAPGGCHLMTSCAPTAMSGDAHTFASVAPRAYAEPAWSQDHLRSVTRSPEPPPPRA